ncbi:unnamed protein product [Meloidogyne enterolobii]|uniref:Uncharacterized protein n=1 Tax=Meloidogyne enterolobii TaxID=390850 RepID=A0ACB1AJH3_MELEN
MTNPSLLSFPSLPLPPFLFQQATTLLPQFSSPHIAFLSIGRAAKKNFLEEKRGEGEGERLSNIYNFWGVL